jgi:cholesterol transport system auxiliary component
MKMSIMVLSIWIGFLGCTKAPAIKVYGLDVPVVKEQISSKYQYKSVKVTYPQSLKEQMSQKMNFSYSMSDRGVYLNSEWSNDMAKLLQGTLIEILSDAKLFKVVLSDATTLKENYRLESNVFAFEHRVRGDLSSAVLSIQFALIDADTGKLVKSKRLSYSEPTPTVNAEGYAKATNIALARLSSDLVAWLR